MPGTHDPYQDLVRYYDSENASKTDDLPFYQALNERFGEPILCVGSGTGRVVFPLVQAGSRVVGVDPSHEMLRRAREAAKALSITGEQADWIRSDIRDLALAEHFSLIIFPYNGFMHLHSVEDQLAALKKMAGHLAPGGVIALALPNPIELFLYEDDDEPALEREFVDRETGEKIIQYSQIAQDRAKQMLHILWIYERQTQQEKKVTEAIPVSLRLSFAPELSLLCAAAGLPEVTFFGDHDMSPYHEASPHLLVLAGREEA